MIALVFARPLASGLGVSTVLVVLAAFATAGWSLALRQLSRLGGLRPWLVGVLFANVLVAGLIAVLAVSRSLDDALSVLLLAVATEVGAFAAVQAFALRRWV